MLVGYCKRDSYRVLIHGSKRVGERKEVTTDENGVVREQAQRKYLIATNHDDDHGVMEDLIFDDNEGAELNMTDDSAISPNAGKVAEDTIEATIEEEIEDGGHKAVDEAGDEFNG